MNPELSKALDVIFRRRSVRSYTGEPVNDETVTALLEAAMAAPSAVAKDPWRFIVIRERETLRTIAGFLPNGGMLADAAVGFVVCGDITAAHDGEMSYMLQDCSAAIENLLLAATALDLGACWLGVHPRQDRVDNIRALFDLPDGIIPISCIAVGHPAQSPESRTRYTSEYVHHESW